MWLGQPRRQWYSGGRLREPVRHSQLCRFPVAQSSLCWLLHWIVQVYCKTNFNWGQSIKKSIETRNEQTLHGIKLLLNIKNERIIEIAKWRKKENEKVFAYLCLFAISVWCSKRRSCCICSVEGGGWAVFNVVRIFSQDWNTAVICPIWPETCTIV